MMRSLFSGVSGLKNHQTRMDVIGNNISNVNTTGYKSARVTFTDTIQQTLTGASAPNDVRGGTNPKQIGLGSAIGSIDLIMTDGSVQSTGKNTDVCISGSGFFVVNGPNGTYYTRNGAFEFDADGTYVLPGSGLYVQGWMADESGTINVNPAKTDNIVVQAGKPMNPTETKAAVYTRNLNSSIEASEISSLNITYADGLTENVNNYNPTRVEKGDVLNVNFGARSIMTDQTADEIKADDPDPKTNATVNAEKKVFTQKIDAMAGNLKLTLDGGAYTDIVFADGKATREVDTGDKFYTNGDSFVFTQKIKEWETTTDGKVKLTFDKQGNPYHVESVVVPTPVGQYAIGDEFTFDLMKIAATGGVQQNGTGDAVFRFANGEEVKSGDIKSFTPPPTDLAINGEPLALQLRDLGVDALNSVTTSAGGAYFFHGKEVQSASAVLEGGKTASILLGKDYNTGEIFYPSCATTFTVYDKQGNEHDVPVLFTKSDANTWELSFAGGTDTYKVYDGDSVTTMKLQASNLEFNLDGSYKSGAAQITLDYNYIDETGELVTEEGNVQLLLNGLTQFAGSSTIKADADGNAFGSLASVSIDSSGIITGSYTNGVNRQEAQIAMAQFNNPGGLTKTGQSLYSVSNNSGEPSLNSATAIGATLTASALEMSNVDIANEFTDMIVTQRGFQSNSKIVTVSDEMLETLINMKR